jgi:chondroitin AC lyase
VKRFLILIFIALQLTAFSGLRAVVAAEGDEFSTVVSRYRALLLSGYVPTALMEWNTKDTARWIETLETDGRWPDIDYANRAGGAWQTLAHLRRVRILAREIESPNSPWYQSEHAWSIIERALTHWATQRYQNPNWWQNQIGTPQVMRDIIVLLGDRLEGEARAGALAVLHQLKLMDAGIGANTVWSAELALMAAAIERDAVVAKRASALIAGEIVMGAEQGIQDDYSFLQHGARLQQFHYGSSFFKDTVRLAWLLRGTTWAVPAEKAALLAEFALQGNKWMRVGRATVPGTLDRAASRPGALAGADMEQELRLLEELLPARSSDPAWRALRTGSVSGFRAFPRADFAAHHRGGVGFFLKTISTRTEITETLSRENQKGRKLNWGDHYVLTPQTDYVDLPPVWNWDLLPGVTSSVEMTAVHRKPFVGSVSNDDCGAVAMDYRVGDAEQTMLTARKFWVMKDGMMIALIAGLEASRSGEPVRTALDQRRLKGEITLVTQDGTQTVSQSEASEVRRGVKWIHHDGLVYAPLGDEPLTLLAGPVTGSWHAINLNYADVPVTESMFLPVLEHGRELRNQTSGFLIATAPTAADAEMIFSRPSWQVLRNDSKVQAVAFADGTVMAVFSEAGAVTLSSGLELKVTAPCLVLLENDGLRASDPTHGGRKIGVILGDKSYSVECPRDGKNSAKHTF